MNNREPDGQLKPLTLWEKVKVGVSSFIKSAVDYIPSGLVYAGLAIGTSFLLNATLGWDPLQVAGASIGEIALKGAGTLALGSIVTGGMGAWQGVSRASQQRNAEIEWQQRGVQISPRARGLQRQQSTGYGQTSVPQMGLPQQQRQGQGIAPSMR